MAIQSVSPQLRLSISYITPNPSPASDSPFMPSLVPLPRRSLCPFSLYLFLAPPLASPPLTCPTFSTYPIPSLSISPTSPIHFQSLPYLHLHIPPIDSPSVSHILVPPLLLFPLYYIRFPCASHLSLSALLIHPILYPPTQPLSSLFLFPPIRLSSTPLSILVAYVWIAW